ncbi:hypothetical protein N3K66_006160 [Trichothecium roseum]|uniref:Uncharacterized protein n=1 Tax=Trichothecium roseum TaxID=47278 RepID=A0ACC0UZX3_9HYPO|nr:hypothetical protein N3K66_006160 [Trichothecium roseum]
MHVCILLFQGHDVLDYAGPYEVFANVLLDPDSPSPQQAFDVTLVAADRVIQSSRNLCVNRHLSIDEGLAAIEDFDILVVPGGPLGVLRRICQNHQSHRHRGGGGGGGGGGGPELRFLRAFARVPRQPGRCERVILSVCTGALLLGYSQLLRGRRATTHHKALDVLRYVCNGSGSSGDGAQKGNFGATEVIRARYVDGGRLENGTRIVTSGGISNGIDASMYVLSLVAGRDMAAAAGRIMEFDRSSSLGSVEGYQDEAAW